jgi:threonine dehydrogenase-like Zn-dependent dehydrogenase
MDVSETRLAFCRDRLGIAEVIDARNEPAEQVRKLTGGDMATVVIDATGNLQSMNKSIGFLAPGGKLVYVGLAQGEFSLNDPEFHRRETTLLGSRNALPEDFAAIIELVQAGKIDTGAWITHRTAAGDFAGVFGDWIAPGSGLLKGMIEF